MESFQQFINGLKLVDNLGKSDNRLFVEELANKYGLPTDETAIQQLERILDEVDNISPLALPDPLSHYVMTLLWDILARNTQPLTACSAIFLLGTAFGRIADIEPSE